MNRSRFDSFLRAADPLQVGGPPGERSSGFQGLHGCTTNCRAAFCARLGGESAVAKRVCGRAERSRRARLHGTRPEFVQLERTSAASGLSSIHSIECLHRVRPTKPHLTPSRRVSSDSVLTSAALPPLHALLEDVPDGRVRNPRLRTPFGPARARGGARRAGRRRAGPPMAGVARTSVSGRSAPGLRGQRF